MSPVNEDIPVQQKELAEKRHLENFPLGNPPEVERYEIEGRNIQAGLVIDHYKYGLRRSIYSLPVTRNFHRGGTA